MHWLGKLFLGLTILLAGLDAYFALVLLAHRDTHQTAYEQAQRRYDEVHVQLLQARLDHRERQYELDRLESTWGDFWQTEGSTLRAGDATFRIAAGSAAGLPTPAADGTPPRVYIFHDDPEDGSTFLGEFSLGQVQADQSAGRLTRTPFGMETADWPTGAVPIRVRERVPSAWRTAFDKLFAQYVRAEVDLDTQTHQLRILNEQLAKSQEILDQRIAELNGDPEPPEGASQDVVDGLVETIRREEVARNDDLEQLYQLRRDYSRMTERLNRLIARNLELARQLPGAAAAASPVTPVETSTTSIGR